ncbi:MAG: hypothetical protein ACRDP4_15955 [Nocardioidaceae bacterium]
MTVKAFGSCGDGPNPFEDLRGRDYSANNVRVVKEPLTQLRLAAATVRPPSHLLDSRQRHEVTEALRLLT